jgi:aspartyl aminopeptidase
MIKESILEISKLFAKEIIVGLNKSITPFHAVDYSKGKLVEKGFQEIQEK